LTAFKDTNNKHRIHAIIKLGLVKKKKDCSRVRVPIPGNGARKRGLLTVKKCVAFDPQAYGSRVSLLHSGVTQDIKLWIRSKLPRVLHLTY
jgi:hypothetical protein